MSEMGETFKALKDTRRQVRAKYGKPCPECQRLLPNASPTILLPGWRCNRRGHKYTDPRPKLTDEERMPGWTITHPKDSKQSSSD